MRFYSLLRESSDAQERKKGLARQWRQLHRFCETWPKGPHEVVHYAQIIESASRGSRLEWQEAVERGIKLYQDGTVNGILFPEVDRETRNPVISIPILNLALDAGVPVFFAEEALYVDPRDPNAIQRYTDAMARSCAYLATMVQKCRSGRFDRANIDHKLPSYAGMFGFDVVDGERVPNEAEAEALKQAAQIALSAGRTRPAVDWLNDKGFHGRQDKAFTTVTLGGLFRNRALIGETIINFKEKKVILKHKGILGDATFEALQVMLDGHRRAQRSDVFYCLSGLNFCGCGARFEASKMGVGRYYYRCERHCGEKAWRKDSLEWEVNEAFSRYLEHRESQQAYLELAQKSRARLEEDQDKVEHDLAANKHEWKILLDKDLAGYPDIVISEKKRELTTERQSLEQRQTGIKAELEALPDVDPEEVETALSELAKPWQMANTGGYYMPHPMSWERASVPSGNWRLDMEQKLTNEQAHCLRQMLLKLNCRITIKNQTVFISGRVPLARVRAKQVVS